jgi:O-antigen/teichoic acid export membrane protein
MSKIKGFVGETIIYGFGNVFSRLFAMLLIPLYIQYLGKIDYSNLIMLQLVFGVLTLLMGLNAGVFFYYYEYNNLKYKKIVFVSWFYFQIVVALSVLLLLYLFSPWIYNIFIVEAANETVLRWCLVLVGVQLFPFIINNTNINYYRIERKPGTVIFIVLMEAFTTLGLVYINLEYLEHGLIGVIVSQIIARLFVSTLFAKRTFEYIRLRYFSRKLLKKIFAYSWPFILSGVFMWVVISVDKFIGSQLLKKKSDVALLALSMQLVLPMSVLADMIRMAIGPFVMSIRKEIDSEKTYQQVFDLVVFVGSLLVVVVVSITPFLTLLLADDSFIGVVFVVPLMAFGTLIYLIANQFCISFNLVKKNTYILYSILIAGIINITLNVLLMGHFGYVVSGYSQIAAYLFMSIFLYYFGKKVAGLSLLLRNSMTITGVVIAYIVSFYFIIPLVYIGVYIELVISSVTALILIFVLYSKQQKINFVKIMLRLIKK